MLSLAGAASTPPKPLTEAALRQFISKALDKGWVREGYHSEVQRADRNISHDDILHGLERNWKLLSSRPPSDPRHVGYTYTLQTVDLEGDDLILVVCPMQDQTLKVVTKY